MSLGPKLATSLGTAVVAVIALATNAARNNAWADDAPCLGNAGNVCRTVAVQTCQEWGVIGIPLFGGGVTIGCVKWVIETHYYYYDFAGGTPGKPGLK
ncbi:MAG TPA: hypothetical protein VFT29_18100 [Gemmatimonadaceae bacterium]|nr:hypothetical protein [Gemmatimonadaceae bacterium]